MLALLTFALQTTAEDACIQHLACNRLYSRMKYAIQKETKPRSYAMFDGKTQIAKMQLYQRKSRGLIKVSAPAKSV